jgi:MFS family permease
VALVIGIVPEATRLATTAAWARLFDRYNFVGIRMAINLILLASVIAFFWGRTFPWLCVSAVLEGMMLAGGNIAWALWVTHVAPAKHTAEYMAVHQFFTGVRGVIGALLGIRLASQYGMQPVAWAAVVLVGLSVVLMAPARHDRRWVRAEGGTGI